MSVRSFPLGVFSGCVNCRLMVDPTESALQSNYSLCSLLANSALLSKYLSVWIEMGVPMLSEFLDSGCQETMLDKFIFGPSLLPL